jgi:hypothetical protein
LLSDEKCSWRHGRLTQWPDGRIGLDRGRNDAAHFAFSLTIATIISCGSKEPSAMISSKMIVSFSFGAFPITVNARAAVPGKGGHLASGSAGHVANYISHRTTSHLTFDISG